MGRQHLRLRGLLELATITASLLVEASHCQGLKQSFTIANDTFWKNGEPFQILGGDVHYFRIIPEYWEDRLLRAKALGLNTIQTYVAWNVHEPREGEFHFEGFTDLELFVKLAQRLDLLVMLRIGPYICAEWDLGGFPAWLLARQPQLQLRSSDPAYLELVDKWWKVLLPKVVPLLYVNGGPVIMVQVENEFGSYGRDVNYLKHLVDEVKLHLGEHAIIYTTDGGSENTLENGTLPGDGVYSAVDFPIDWDPATVFALQKKFNSEGKSPALVSEFYTGWLTHWRENIAKTNSEQIANALQIILGLNASVVLYMAHGGTNFGFSSGANTGAGTADYKADITSYDYDAPISEAGDTDHVKFAALRRVLASQYEDPLPEPPPLPLRIAYGRLQFQKMAPLLHILERVSSPPNGVPMQEPCTMEYLNQLSGFILYETMLPSYSRSGSVLQIPTVHDRAQVFVQVNQETGSTEACHVGTIERWSSQQISLPATASSPGSKLQILVENMGRINYGSFLFDPKGIVSSVYLDGFPLFDWKVFPIPLDDMASLKRAIGGSQLLATMPGKLGPLPKAASNCSCGSETLVASDIGFYFGALHIKEPQKPADSFLSMKGWGKGLVFLNGFNLGRYWPSVGPQCTLYVPAPVFHVGDNELVIFEVERPQAELLVEFVHNHEFTCGLSQASYVSTSSILSQKKHNTREESPDMHAANHSKCF